MMRIMYVEDNPANLSLMQRIARMGGHEVVSYTEGEIALERFTADNPDLVLLDVQLAGVLNGLDVVKKLREQGVKKPIIAVTAYAMVGDRERCLEAGFDGYMSKPLPVAELVELVQKYELDAKAVPTSATAAPALSPAATVELPGAATAATTPPASAPPSPVPVTPTPVSPNGQSNEAAVTQLDKKKVLGDVDLKSMAAKKE